MVNVKHMTEYSLLWLHYIHQEILAFDITILTLVAIQKG